MNNILKLIDEEIAEAKKNREPEDFEGNEDIDNLSYDIGWLECLEYLKGIIEKEA